jgi:hypothetical protein
MAREGGQVQLEQSDMRLALNMAIRAKGGFSRSSIEEAKYRMKNPRADIRAEKKWGVEFPRFQMLKAAIQKQQAMLCQNKTFGCLPCQNDTRKNPLTCWTRKGTGAHPPA